MLVNLSKENKIHLLHLYNLLFSTAFVPEVWKCALVIPLLKPGKPPNEPDSYKPMSLTSCLGKTMEKLVNNRLK